MPEDVAVISSKSGIDPCTHEQDINKMRTDRRMAFQLYIVD